jgi:hypothetical protein
MPRNAVALDDAESPAARSILLRRLLCWLHDEWRDSHALHSTLKTLACCTLLHSMRSAFSGAACTLHSKRGVLTTHCICALAHAVAWHHLSRCIMLSNLLITLSCCADCSASFMLNGTLGSDSSWCVACPRGQYCPGGSADNPYSRAFSCTPGLATISEGARSEQQVRHCSTFLA